MAGDDRLGDRIRARRRTLGLTLAQVAEKSGLSIPYVSNLERGRGNPTIDALRALASALGLTASDLLGGNAEEGFDPLDLVLADAPSSLTAFARSARFATLLIRLSEEQGVPEDEMRRRLLVGMASAPRRSASEPTEEDWRRLLDVYRTILTEE